MQMQSEDHLHLSSQPNIISQLQPKQQIKFSTLIKKINQEKMVQQRIFLLTNQAIYNISKRSGLIKSLVCKLISLQSRFCMKRKIPLNKVYGITLSKHRQNGEFILHVTDDYDYRYCAQSHEQKVLVLKKLCEVYSSFHGGKKLSFYFKDEIVLTQFSTRKNDAKHGVDRKPKEEVVYLGEEDFQQYQLPDLNYKLQYSQLQQDSTITMKAFRQIFDIQKLHSQYQYFTVTQTLMQLKHIQQLLILNDKFFIKPSFIFSTKSKLQLLTPFMIGGNLARKLRQSVRISEQLALFYIAGLAMMLQILQEKMLWYDNFCLQHIFIAQNGYLRLLAVDRNVKIKQKDFNSINYHITGYVQYIPPEMILVKGYNIKQVNMWRLGVMAHYLLLGCYPFTGTTTKQYYHEIITKKLSSSTPELLLKLLEKDPQKRISLLQLKSHPKLAHINWEKLKQQTIAAPFLPDTSSWKGNLPAIVQLNRLSMSETTQSRKF